jgi:glycosyltransferase involved in cell wall biosynthesis
MKIKDLQEQEFQRISKKILQEGQRFAKPYEIPAQKKPEKEILKEMPKVEEKTEETPKEKPKAEEKEKIGEGPEEKFPKKLLIAADTYFPKKDGVIIFLRKIIPAIKNYEITVLAPGFEKEVKPIKNSKLVFLEVSKRLKLADYNSIRFSRENIRKIKKEVAEADLIFVQDVGPIGALSIHYANKFSKPVIIYMHQITWEQLTNVISTSRFLSFLAFIIRILVRRLYNKCSLVLVPYRSLAEELRKEGIFTKEAVIRLGVSSDIFSPAENKAEAKKAIGIDPSKTVIGYCGRISKEKNLNTLRRAYSRLREDYNNIFLLIVGSGSEEEIRKFSEIRDVKITGFVNNVSQYLKAMDIFVMPSLTETTSLATVEAMSAGLAVMATKVGYIKEYIMDKYNGLFFPKKNDYLLRKKLEMLIQDKRLRLFLGKNARETAIEKFSWNKTVNDINKALEMF